MVVSNSWKYTVCIKISFFPTIIYLLPIGYNLLLQFIATGHYVQKVPNHNPHVGTGQGGWEDTTICTHKKSNPPHTWTWGIGGRPGGKGLTPLQDKFFRSAHQDQVYYPTPPPANSRGYYLPLLYMVIQHFFTVWQHFWKCHTTRL